MRLQDFSSILISGLIFSMIFFLLISALPIAPAKAKKVTWAETVKAAQDLGFSPTYLNWLVEWSYLGRPNCMIDGKPYPKHLIRKWVRDLNKLDKKLGLK